jgi:flagellar protein FlgJ
MNPTLFFQTYSGYAIDTHIKKGVPASITLAQAAIESGWAQYAPGNNFFGIKADANYNGPYFAADTTEYQNGAYQHITAKFRKYSSPQGSFNDHAAFLKSNSRYKNLFALNILDFQGWAKGLQADGYATDPAYSQKIISMINLYNLTQYDNRAEQKKKL